MIAESLQRSDPLRKAAILIASLDRQTADVLLDQMTPQQADLVRRTAVALDTIDPNEQEQIISEFLQISPPPEQPSSGVELAGSLLRRMALGNAGLPLETDPSVERQDWPPFRFLSEAQCEQLRPLLETEHPQTIALVASHLPPDRAAGLLAELPAALQADVIRRLVDLDETNPEILREVERGLETRISRQNRDEKRHNAGLAALTGILNAAGRLLERQILNNLTVHAPHLAQKLARPRKTVAFDDLTLLDDRSLQVLLEAADPQIAVLALAGSNTQLVDRVLRQMPSREAELMRRAWEQLPPTSLSDVEDAQQELAALADRLDSQGQIDLARMVSSAA